MNDGPWKIDTYRKKGTFFFLKEFQFKQCLVLSVSLNFRDVERKTCTRNLLHENKHTESTT